MPAIHTFQKAVQSNKVYLPRMSSSPSSNVAARQINAIPWAAIMRTLLVLIPLTIFLPLAIGEEVKKPSSQEMEARIKQLIQLEAQISAEHDKLPKREYISLNSPRKQFKDYATLAARHIESVANLNYPSEIKGVYGTVKLTIEILPNGQVAEIQIFGPSGIRLLEEAAVKLAIKAAPFPPFEWKFKNLVDILYLTLPFNFSREDRLEPNPALWFAPLGDSSGSE